MDYVTPAGRTEAAEIAARIGRALDELADAGSDAVALLVSRQVLSPAAPQWRKVSALLATRPYLGDLRRLQEALAAIAESDEAATAAEKENGNGR
jgi:hypothetical protein